MIIGCKNMKYNMQSHYAQELCEKIAVDFLKYKMINILNVITIQQYRPDKFYRTVWNFSLILYHSSFVSVGPLPYLYANIKST